MAEVAWLTATGKAMALAMGMAKNGWGRGSTELGTQALIHSTDSLVPRGAKKLVFLQSIRTFWLVVVGCDFCSMFLGFV